MDFKWEIEKNTIRNQEEKNSLLKKILEMASTILTTGTDILVYFDKNQVLNVSFSIEYLQPQSVKSLYYMVESLLVCHNFTPFIRLNEKVDSLWAPSA